MRNTRRRLIQTIGCVGGGGILSKWVTRSKGTDSRKTIVLKRDKWGNPAVTKQIAEERYNRIKTFGEFNFKKTKQENPQIKSFGLKQRSEDPSDLVIEIELEKNTRENRGKSPSKIKNVPVTYTEAPSEYREVICDDHVYPGHDPIEGNIETYGKVDGNTSGDGTHTLVAWDGTENKRVHIVSHHVIEEDGVNSPNIYLTDYNDGQEYLIGSYSQHDENMDTAKYDYEGDLDANALGMYHDEVPDITGTWTFDGLSEATTGGTVQSNVAGRTTCYWTPDCFDTKRNSLYEYTMVLDEEASGGDSGSPVVDNDGYLIGMVASTAGGDTFGPTGQELLDAVNAGLSPPSLN